MNSTAISKSAAEKMCERINKLIRNFEKSLQPDEVAAMSLASFSNRPVIIKRLGYWNPDLIVLYGFDPNTGEALKIIQHITQFKLCLITLKRPADDEPLPETDDDEQSGRRIGFIINEEDNNEPMVDKKDRQ
ncbi:MAG: hypothetical protein SPL86_09925 [Succiniclasticum sp.]|uniref:hypothetical protein n=1 Tax=Succiniclasticum sp. TaxID=2775030 RepID=UPI002A9177B2|nr:hypothetical protein [Succiniclasticum sp.]MBR1493800.1 hypothetical protein [Acidaminococcaceae bacterium]MDY6291788.1 hypothetical protein [Succiniclasticum sp.]